MTPHNPENGNCPLTLCEHTPDEKQCPCTCEPKENYVDSMTPEERAYQDELQKSVVVTTTSTEPKENCPECQFESGHALTCSKYVEEKWPKEELLGCDIGSNDGNAYVYGRKEGDSVVITDVVHTPKEEGWEKEFDELLGDYLADFYATSLGMYTDDESRKLNKENDEALIDFIRSLLQKERERARREALEEVRGEMGMYFGHLENDGVTGEPMIGVSIEEIARDTHSIIRSLLNLMGKK